MICAAQIVVFRVRTVVMHGGAFLDTYLQNRATRGITLKLKI